MRFEFKVLENDRRIRHIECAYDREKFDIKVNDNNDVCIYLKKDNKLVGIFGQKNEVEFICQDDSKRGTIFYVSSVVRDDGKKRCFLTTYSFLEQPFDLNKDDVGCLYEDYQYNICSPNYEAINLSDKAFMIEGSKNSGRILSRATGEVSEEFSKISSDSFGDIIVERNIKSAIPEVCDFIFYGIDASTFEPTTDIYSKNQDTFFSLLSSEKIDKAKKKIESNLQYSLCSYLMNFDSPLEATITIEIREKLREQAEELWYLKNGDTNPDFIKKLGTHPGADTKEENK